MKFAFYLRQDAPPHRAIAEAVVAGAKRAGEEAFIYGKAEEQVQAHADCLVLFGVGGDAREVWAANVEAGKRTVFVDKGYTRGNRAPGQARERFYIMRVAVGGFQPTAYLMDRPRGDDRAHKFGLTAPAPYGPKGEHILFDGASNKYCLWNGLGHWHEWGQRTIDLIRAHTDRPIIYRPRPDNNPPLKPAGAAHSDRPLDEDLARARVVVSHGGNIGFDAIMAGVPHFAIGDSCARPVSETRWSSVDRPLDLPSWRKSQWLANLAYCQWTMDEFADGTAWRYIREVISGLDNPRRIA